MRCIKEELKPEIENINSSGNSLLKKNIKWGVELFPHELTQNRIGF